MKATATELQASFPPGHPAGVPTPPPSALTIAIGVLGLSGLTTVYAVAGPLPKATVHQLILVGGPMSILTGYPGFPPQGLLTRAGGAAIQVVSVTAIALQGSFVALGTYILGQAGVYAEGKVHQHVRQRITEMVHTDPGPQPGEEHAVKQGDTLMVWGTLTEGSLTLERRYFGPAYLEEVHGGAEVRPGDIVVAGEGKVRVARVGGMDEVIMDPLARQLNGVTALRAGHHSVRMRRQVFFWSAAVAVVTAVLTGSVDRVIAVLLAGAPTFLDVVGGASTWQETRKWVKKGVLPNHPLSLIAAGEVDTVLFDQPEPPDRKRIRELTHLAEKLHQYDYRVGLLTGGPPQQMAELANAIDADLAYSGTPEERAVWVASLFERRLVAVVGQDSASVPAMATSHLAVASGTEPRAVAAAHVVMTGPLDDLPDFLADNRQTGRAEQHGETITKTLILGATLAAAVGLLGAASVVTVTSLLGMGLVGLKSLLGSGKKGKSTAEHRLGPGAPVSSASGR